MKLAARAKINWTLDIVGRRADGYHLMDMLMQPVTLCDEIVLNPAACLSLTIDGSPEIKADETNLAWRAAEALRRETGCRSGAEIHVTKRIPSQAGLGGGSADAAAVLAGLNRMWGLNLGEKQLERIGLSLGADVPFCLHGGFCRVRGIGEELEELDTPPERSLVIVQPCGGLSTKAVFEAYHAAGGVRHPDNSAAVQLLLSGESLTDECLGNVMQEVSAGMRPEIPEAVKRLEETGASCAQMSGSGSAVFGVYVHAEQAEKARLEMERIYGAAFRCTSCSESITFMEE